MKKLPAMADRFDLLMVPLIVLGFASGAIAAAPTVDGNTLSWPEDNGRYEVRLTLTGELVCESGQPCTVSDGRYRVTHFSDDGSSTTDVVVGSPVEITLDQTSFPYALQVTGRTINWTTDDWYQVQDARTYEEICNGTDSCTVPVAGQYTVINHSLGLRTELEVSERSGPVVSGNTISWPRDGWYQVKDEVSGSILCEGVDACSLPDGAYTVSRFYLDGGTTWRVVLTSEVEQPSGPIAVENTIPLPDDGWYQVQLTLTGEVVCESGQPCTVPDGHYRVTGISDGVTSSSWDVVVGQPAEPDMDQASFLRALKVSGLTIDWFFDGWYQVQDANTYEEICGGTDSCTVPGTGQYIVINHSLGLRAELEVSDSSGPRVNNNTISWPRDGWYQVKDDLSGRILCEGVDACSFPDGAYSVSRLYYGGGSTWPVLIETQAEPGSGPTVIDNTISWPDDGWYQVENRVTGAIVCQGGQSCTVVDGIYWVIRFHDEGSSSAWRVIVGEPAELDIDEAGFAETLSLSGRQINWSLGGWYQVQDAQTYESICNGADSCTVPVAGQYIVINHSLGLRVLVEVEDGV